jgi:tRNA A-37 threonylcarbamoyl transferase component Bud32/DNA-binding NarL/FixJ family response regulator
MRLLAIEQEPRVQALIRHHASCRWPAVEVVAYPPVERGPIPPEFLAQGFDAVLLAQSWPGGDGMEWLRDLANREGFAPVIFMLDREDARAREAASGWGAFAVVSKHRFAHAALLESIESASHRHRLAMAEWRVSDAARESHRFGDAHIPGYRRARLLARGSVSHLYIAESEKAEGLVVLKVTPSQRDDSGIDQSFERFLQEYEIAERIRHPNIVHLHELGIADNHAYLAMEYFPLGDLRRRMKAGLSPAESLQYAAQLAEVLGAIHEAGILHRDLKPGNVMLRTAEQLALIDFGMAKQAALQLDLTDKGLIFGTPHYMSPEQGHGQRLDARSDLYSLGVVLFELLTGEKPYRADNPMTVLYMHRNTPIPRLDPRLALLQPLIDRMLAKEPDDRYPDAAATAAAITAARALWLAEANGA